MKRITRKLLTIIAIMGVMAATMATAKIDVQAAKAKSASTLVYVSTADVCYHNDGCKCLKADKVPVDITQAISFGFTACTKCNAPVVAGAAVAPTTNAVAVPAQNVWLSATGDKYHSRNNCGKMNPNKAYQVTLEQAKAKGKSACKKCF